MDVKGADKLKDYFNKANYEHLLDWYKRIESGEVEVEYSLEEIEGLITYFVNRALRLEMGRYSESRPNYFDFGMVWTHFEDDFQRYIRREYPRLPFGLKKRVGP